MKITTAEEMLSEIGRIGFMPFLGSKKGLLFTLEGSTDNAWFTGLPSDPWEWRHMAAQSEQTAYGKFFLGSMGFVAREHLPAFIALRREGKTMQELYEEGSLSREAKILYQCFDFYPFLDAPSLKGSSGLSKGAFDAALSELQRLFLLCVSGYTYKKNRAGESYGWSVNEYARVETLFPEAEERILSVREAEEELLSCGLRAGDFPEEDILKLLRSGGVKR